MSVDTTLEEGSFPETQNALQLLQANWIHKNRWGTDLVSSAQFSCRGESNIARHSPLEPVVAL
jgi:hypothetical protein